jgi:hypothetical protein
MKYQVVIEDKQGFIHEYKDFKASKRDRIDMLTYVHQHITRNDTTIVVKITRWDSKGNKV